jgi:PAS domain S-box-containing protein
MSQADLPLVRAIQRGELVQNQEIIQVNARGQRVPLLCNAGPIHGPEGEITGGVVTWRDISEYKRAGDALRESELRFRSLFNSMTEGFAIHEMITDEAGQPCDYRFVDINPAFERLTGLQREAVIGKTLSQVLPNEDPRWVQEYGKVVLTGEPAHFENYAPALHRYYDVYAYQNAPRQFAVIFMDITSRKQTEMALEQANAALQAYTAQLRSSNEALEDFAFIASHDLKEPLRKVQSFSERLQSRYSQALDAQGQDYIERIRQAASRMQSMLDGLLAYSRAATRVQTFKKVDLKRAVLDVLSDLEVRLMETRGRVEIGELPVIEADPLQMRQLLQNLIGNALKFHRPGTPPLVKVTCNLDSPTEIELVVADNGIGFPMDQVNQLFLPFHRLHGRSEYEGAGMGLAICRKIVERHGGTISARSEAGEGATFVATLPRQPRPQ